MHLDLDQHLTLGRAVADVVSRLLPEEPDWPEFMQGCVMYRQSLDEQIAKAKKG